MAATRLHEWAPPIGRWLSKAVGISSGSDVIAVAPYLARVLIMWFLNIRRIFAADNYNTIMARQISNIWGRSLNKLRTVTLLSHERITLTHTELETSLQGNSTHIYVLIAISYKCVQTCNAIQTLCEQGFPDQALSLCRGLVEQEANLRFFMTIDNREEVAERYIDWERAKTINRWKAQNKELVKSKLDFTNEEWDALNEVYAQLAAKHSGNGNLRHHEEWAIGTRAKGLKRIKAFSPEARAQQFIKVLASDEIRLRDTWTKRWQRLNEFVHITPRSIFESPASNDQKLVVTGPSHLGIDEPLIIAGQSMLNISTMLTLIVTEEFAISENQRIEDIGSRAIRAFNDVLEEVEKVPGSTARWHSTVTLP